MIGITLAPYGQIPGAFPYGVSTSYGGDGTYYCDDTDPFQNQRGEPGFYSDTQLGLPFINPAAPLTKAIALKKLHGLGWSLPADIDLAPTYGYTPQMTGWVTTKEGFVQNPWVPPNGWRPAPLNGFGATPPSIGFTLVALVVGGAVAGAIFGSKRDKAALYAGLGSALGALVGNYIASGTLIPTSA